MIAPRQWRSSAGVVDLAGPRTASRIRTLAAAPQSVRLDLARTALVVIDMQNDFCSPGGWLDSIGVDIGPAAGAVPAINSLTSPLRAAQVPVLWLNWANRADRANLPANVLHVYDGDGTGGGIGARANRSEAVLTEGSWGAAIVDELDVDPNDLQVGKFRMSGFWDTALDSILRMRGVETLLFAGVNADQCVLATLIDAACIGYDCVLIEGASSTTSPAYCMAATLYNVRQCFGFTTTPEAVLACLTDREEHR